MSFCCAIRRLYDEQGRFELGNMQDWQHSAMYGAFMLSGAADLIGHFLPGVLPPGTEHVSVKHFKPVSQR